MTSITGPAFERSLRALRAEREPVSVAGVARRLLALRDAPDPGVARRIVATALGVHESDLPDPLEGGSLRPVAESRVAAVSLAHARFAVVDLETTGLSRDRSEILEIGAVLVARLRVAARFDSLVRPGSPVPERISALTGIDDAAVVDAPRMPTAVRAFHRWLVRNRVEAFVAHNAGFDAGFVTRDLAACGLPPLGVPILCTRLLSRRILPGLGRYNLDHLCAHLGIANGARHRALGDADATARALIDLVEIGRADGIATLGDLIDLQAAPPPRVPRKRR